jgi:hypothetical protein
MNFFCWKELFTHLAKGKIRTLYTGIKLQIDAGFQQKTCNQPSSRRKVDEFFYNLAQSFSMVQYIEYIYERLIPFTL